MVFPDMSITSKRESSSSQEGFAPKHRDDMGRGGLRRKAAAPALKLCVALIAMLFVTACGDNYPELVNQQYQRVRQQVEQLGGYLSSGRIRNAKLINSYSRYVARKRPDVAEIAKELGLEGTTKGLAYQSLLNRMKKVNRQPKDEKEADTGLEELLRIEAASDWSVFNDSLIDVVNVLADMSEGKLAKLHVPKSEASPEKGAGSRLVGNPRYGQWRNDSSGQSFWAWYGQYALFRTMFFPRSYYYNSWYGHRSWSYYGDVGRHYYGTRGDTSRWRQASRTQPSRPRKSYGSLRSQRRLSTYGRAGSRTSGSALKRASSYASSSRGGSRSSGSRRGK